MSFSDVYVLVNLMIRTIKKQNLLINSFSKIFQQKSKSNKRFCWSSDQSNCFSPITVIDYQSQNKSYKRFFFLFLTITGVCPVSSQDQSVSVCRRRADTFIRLGAMMSHILTAVTPDNGFTHSQRRTHRWMWTQWMHVLQKTLKKTK